MSKSKEETIRDIKETLKDFDASQVKLSPEEKARFIIERAAEEASKYTDYTLGKAGVA